MSVLVPLWRIWFVSHSWIDAAGRWKKHSANLTARWFLWSLAGNVHYRTRGWAWGYTQDFTSWVEFSNHPRILQCGPRQIANLLYDKANVGISRARWFHEPTSIWSLGAQPHIFPCLQGILRARYDLICLQEVFGAFSQPFGNDLWYLEGLRKYPQRQVK